ncbi:TetR/AcrR family transcriptional regulator [Nonomuraea sp. NPDC050790]|uniref:TetR/AcrR family transcriptional regulator n=1 Tax=Nonomuraea sp. NPDC050790 TaxID=3364371 RepID=UPI0037A0274A
MAGEKRPRGGLADKRRAILAGALTVFARDGYTRASVDAIAAAAGVSTRTIYNHFTDKAELFREVIQESAARAAEAQIDIIDRHLRKVTDLEADLVEFGLDLARPMGEEHAAHFALVRQVNAEAGHIPEAAVEAWKETGPRRVRRTLAGHLGRLAEQGLLRDGDRERAAVHLMLLVTAGDPPTEEDVVAGVRAFLHGHGGRR